jgi:hypothetical protein
MPSRRNSGLLPMKWNLVESKFNRKAGSVPCTHARTHARPSSCLTSSSVKSIIGPQKPACRRRPGCGALRAGRHQPGWRPSPPLTHCASRMATSLRRRLGDPNHPHGAQPPPRSPATPTEPNLPHGAPAAPFVCSTLLRSTNAEHTLTCHVPHKLRVLCHDEIVDVRRALQRGGVPSTKEPSLTVLHPQLAGLQPPTGSHGDLLFSPEGQQCVGDVSVIHPGASTYCAVAAETDGGAATQRDADKTALYRGYGAGCYRFVPLTLEALSRLGKPLMKLITDVSDQATQHSNGTFTREQFVTGVLRELSVCFCRRNASLEQAVTGCFVRASGGSSSPGFDPTAEVGYHLGDRTSPQSFLFRLLRAAQ